MGYAFVSYSSKNASAAKTVREILVKRSVNIWMAPYDIPAGSKYAAVINRAVRDCACFLLLLTNEAQESNWVEKEVERAIHYNKSVITLQLEDLALNDSFEFYLCDQQIVRVFSLDEDSPELESALQVIKGFAGEAPALQILPTEREDDIPDDLSSEEAKGYYRRAVKGDGEAQFLLGLWCYYYGEGARQDEEKSIYWLTRAAEQGYAEAEFVLGECYYNGRGLEQDTERAVYWYKRSAGRGYTAAQNALGDCYYYGYGVEGDYVKALYWYKKSASGGNADARYNLGMCYYDGSGTDVNYSKAVYWWKRAASGENVFAQYMLGECFLKGLLGEKDLDKARLWYTRAAEQGYEDARAALEGMK